MPKMKTRRATAKRFRVNAKGTIKRGRGNRSHLLTRRAANRMRRLRRGALVSKSDKHRIKQMLPYS